MFQVQNLPTASSCGSLQSPNNRPPNTTWTTACSRAKTSKSQSPTTISTYSCQWRSSRPRSLCWKNAVKISILTQVILLSLTHTITYPHISFSSFFYEIKFAKNSTICHQEKHLTNSQCFPLSVGRNEQKIHFHDLSVETWSGW